MVCLLLLLCQWLHILAELSISLQKDWYKHLKLVFDLEGLRLSSTLAFCIWHPLVSLQNTVLILRMLNSQLPGSYKMDPISFSCSYNLLAVMTAKVVKNSTLGQGKWPLSWKHLTDQHTIPASHSPLKCSNWSSKFHEVRTFHFSNKIFFSRLLLLLWKQLCWYNSVLINRITEW